MRRMRADEEQKEMMRVIKTAEGDIVLDVTGRKMGEVLIFANRKNA